MFTQLAQNRQPSSAPHREAAKDTALFLWGVVAGSALQFIFQALHRATPQGAGGAHAVVAVLQIYANALLLRHTHATFEGSGLFLLGLVSPQTLLVRSLLRR